MASNSNLCRACLGDTNLNSLFPEHVETTSILEKFICITNLDVSAVDEYPKYICTNCMNQLSIAYDFWNKCRDSLDKLNNMQMMDDVLELKYDVDSEPELDISNQYDEAEQGIKNENDDTESELSDPDYELPLIERLKAERVYEEVITCSKCKRDLNSKDELSTHICKDIIIICEQCGEKFNYIQDKYKHMEVHNYACSICPKVSKTAYEFKIHEETHTGERSYACNKCDMAFMCERILRMHESIIHKVHHKFLCSFCNKNFRNSTLLKRHLKTHPKLPKKKSHLCQNCGKVFKSAEYLKSHIQAHSDVRNYICKVCGKGYKTAKILYAHNVTHTAEKKHTCEKCGAKFIAKGNLKAHFIRHHTNEKPFACRFCPKAFKFAAILRIHERQHTGEKPYACKECSMAFVCATRLTEHMLKHTGIRKYKCNICEKMFMKPQHLKTHMVSHTGECRHKCKVCEKAFKYSQILKSHMKVHEG